MRNSPQKFLTILSRFLPVILILVFLLTQNAFSQTSPAIRQLIVEDIEIVGNNKTKRDVILRHLNFGVGDPIDPFVIDINNQRLSQTNFFKAVQFYTRRGSEKGKLVVIIEVKERRWPYFQFEGGHNDLDGWFFVPASLRFDNLFGRGSKMGMRILFGDKTNEFSIFYHNNSLFSGKAFLDVQLFNAEQRFVHYFGNLETEHNVEFNGLRLKLGGTKGLFKYLHVAFRSETYIPEGFVTTTNDSIISSFPPIIAGDLGETKISTLSLGLSGDFRDNSAYPMNGFWGALIAESSSDKSNSDLTYSKITLDARFFKELHDKKVLAFHFKSGKVGEDAPFYERFYLGGANSLRGYPFSRLTPLVGGTKLILTNTEFRFPLTTKNFPYHKSSGVVFFA
ncbi:BamA/TamA family outer membrane protein, partial [candidate division KSB1 bacterium]|nr:BamA/TamA family outer membrane protein [candidate division KSB1 bacterium]